MKISKKISSEGLTRRDLLKGSGVILGGLALGGTMLGAGDSKALAQQQCPDNECNYPVDPASTQEYGYPTYLFQKGDVFVPDKDARLLADNEMRITFLGTAFPPTRKATQPSSMISVR